MNKAYKTNRAIEKTDDQIFSKISDGENVFQKKRFFHGKFHTTSTGYNDGSIFMTSLLKNSKVHQEPTNVSIVEEEGPNESLSHLLERREEHS